MTTPLIIREVPDYADKHPDSSDRAYLLELLGDRVGLLYVTPEAYTLAWPGSVDFSNLEDETGLAYLAVTGSDPIDWQNDRQRQRVTVSFVLPVDDQEVALREYDLGRTIQFRDYRDTLRTPASIAFARYDFADNPRTEPFFSFIAENKEVRGSDENEVAVKLLRSIRCSPKLLEWLATRHHDTRLQSRVDLRRSATAVANLTKS